MLAQPAVEDGREPFLPMMTPLVRVRVGGRLHLPPPGSLGFSSAFHLLSSGAPGSPPRWPVSSLMSPWTKKLSEKERTSCRHRMFAREENACLCKILSDSFLCSREVGSPAGPRKYENWHFVMLHADGTPVSAPSATRDLSFADEITGWLRVAAVAASTHTKCHFGACLSAPQGLLFVFLKCDEMERAFKNRYFLEMVWLGLLATSPASASWVPYLIVADGTLAKAACIFFLFILTSLSRYILFNHLFLYIQAKDSVESINHAGFFLFNSVLKIFF